MASKLVPICTAAPDAGLMKVWYPLLPDGELVEFTPMPIIASEVVALAALITFWENWISNISFGRPEKTVSVFAASALDCRHVAGAVAQEEVESAICNAMGRRFHAFHSPQTRDWPAVT